MIQDMIIASRRMASLYRFRFIQPAHLLYAITGNETGRELVSRNGYDVCLLRAAMIREFKAYASQVRDPDVAVEPSELFDRCCESYLCAEDDGSYDDALHSVLKAIEAFRAEDRIVSTTLSEADMKRTVEDPCPDEVEVLPDLDDLLRDELEDGPFGTPVRGFKPDEPAETPEGDGGMRSALRGGARQEGEQSRTRPSEKMTKDVEEARAAVKAAQKNLTALAREGALDPVVGRDVEINRVIEILMRRRKPNVILVAEPGVGKSALVEGLAQRLADRAAPDEALCDRPVKEVFLTGMVAGSRFRGDFESRMNILIEQASQERSILFIDEIHMIMGSGAVARGGMDGANILKPALARDNLSVIGATTPEEALILKEDRALMRRFELIYLAEPQRAQMEIILKGAAGGFLADHKVRISPAMQGRLLDFGERYLPYRRNPDRAFDLLDLAAVSARIRGVGKISEQDLRHAVRRLGGHFPLERMGRPVMNPDTLEDTLRSQVKGQGKAITALVAALKAGDARDGFSGVIRLSGPRGIGKTFLVECVARHAGRRVTMIRHDPLRHDGIEQVWGRIKLALEADAQAIIAVQEGDRALSVELDQRMASGGEGRFQAAIGSAMIFCLDSAPNAGVVAGFGGKRSDDGLSEALISMDYPRGSDLEDLVEAVVSELAQLQKDAGERISPAQPVREAMQSVISGGSVTYEALRAAGMNVLMHS